MKLFDPWPVFFRREFTRCWPFLVGFAVTGAIVTKFSLSLTEEDAKNSPFVQRHNPWSDLCRGKVGIVDSIDLQNHKHHCLLEPRRIGSNLGIHIDRIADAEVVSVVHDRNLGMFIVP